GELAGHQPTVPEIYMIATAVLERLSGAGEAILEEDDATLGLQLLAVLGAAAELHRGAQVVFPQPVGQGLRAPGMAMGTARFAVAGGVDLDAAFPIEGDAHANGALVVPRSVAGKLVGRVGIPQIDKRGLGHGLHRVRLTRRGKRLRAWAAGVLGQILTLERTFQPYLIGPPSLLPSAFCGW